MRLTVPPLLADALHWSSDSRPPPAQAAVAALGVGGPILLGVLSGHLPIGMAASVGGLALSGSGSDSGDRLPGYAGSLLRSIITGSAAVWVGIAIAGHGARSALAVTAIGALAGLVGGASRAMAASATQFVLFAIIASRLAEQGASAAGSALCFGAGASWTAAWALLLRPRPPTRPPLQQPSLPAKLRRWRASLATLAGWQYALRLTLCLGLAEAVALLWPHHHAYWIALTVALVVQRRRPAGLARTFQRTAGTAAGVLLGGLLLVVGLPSWSLPLVVAAMAGARPILRTANYLAYAALMTPLIMLLTELDRAPAPGLLLDRLTATLAGAAIALVFGYLAWPPGFGQAPSQ